MALYALVNNSTSKVVNRIQWDGDTNHWSPPAGQTAVPLPAGSLVAIGWTYSGGNFTFGAVAGPTDQEVIGRIAGGAALVTMDELNLLRQWLTDLKAAIAAATSLANLQTRVAAITGNLTPRTKAQIFPAIAAKLNDGSLDS